MAATSKMADLRKLLAERFPHAPPAPRARFITGIPFLDRESGGGLPKSAITELISPRVSAGSASIIHALLRRASQTPTPTVMEDSPREIVCSSTDSLRD